MNQDSVFCSVFDALSYNAIFVRIFGGQILTDRSHMTSSITSQWLISEDIPRLEQRFFGTKLSQLTGRH